MLRITILNVNFLRCCTIVLLLHFSTIISEYNLVELSILTQENKRENSYLLLHTTNTEMLS